MKEILDAVSPLYGVCSFELIQDNLIPCRAKERLPKNAKSVIIMAFPYLLDDEISKNTNVSKYAISADYHGIVLSRLKSAVGKLRGKYNGFEFEPFADNSPIPEVMTAALAGIGVRGRNSLLITKDYGSFVFLGEIVTDMVIPSTGGIIKDCTGCGKCVDACPGNAIDISHINKESCLSDITQKKGELTRQQINMIASSGCAWGCDICQDVCPLNKGISVTDIEEFISTAIPVVKDNTPIEGRAYAWRGEKTIRRNLGIIRSKDEY
ncbi:MAG: DUF1730 domain-containing protein [Clostridia bacterium]|nr:DUF1730 domain-containing protein [Clostridia bacterium]